MKKLLGIIALGLLLSGNAYSAEFSTKTYVNCEPKFNDDWFKNTITDVKYISIDPTVFYYDWHSNKKEFLKKSEKLKTWDYQYIIKINERWSGALLKWEELTIDRYTGIMNIAKTEAGIAAIMGHEVPHALANHVTQFMRAGTIQQGLGVLGTKLLENEPEKKRDLSLTPLNLCLIINKSANTNH